MSLPRSPSQPVDAIPLYALYGEETDVGDSSFIHIEEIAARSSVYDWEIDTHTHRGLFQAVVILQGQAKINLDDLITEVSPGSAITIPPSVVHAFRFEPNTKGYVLTVSEAMMLDASSRRGRVLFDDLFLRPQVLNFEKDKQGMARLADLLDHLLDEFQNTRRGHNSMCEWLAKSVFLMIERQHASAIIGTKTSKGRAELFTRYRALVEDHYLDHWSVGDYAARLNVTPSKLNRTCKAFANRSAFEITQDRLILEARRRLVYIAAPVQTLAYELGFEDPGYFNRFFKKLTGQTPAAFRREQHEKLA